MSFVLINLKAGKLGEVHDALREGRYRVEERHAVAPELGLLGHDEHLIEEPPAGEGEEPEPAGEEPEATPETEAEADAKDE